LPIKEESFRIGCGRYVQKAGALNECSAEIMRLGNSPFIVGGKTALGLTRDKIENSISLCCDKYEIIEYSGACNNEAAERFALKAVENGFKVIVGVGGGVIMDFAKLIGYHAKLPVINIPTSSATCAAYTPLSVCYTEEGRTVGSIHFEYEVSGVLVDTEILAAQPTRLLLAGVFDALAKFVEIKQRFNEEIDEYPLGLDWAYVMAKHSFKELVEKTNCCLADLKAGRITDTVERLFFTTVAVTGVISGIARGSNQTALAHKFYEGTRAMFFNESRQYLDGEIVGLGLLLQNHFNGNAENNEFLLSVMKQYNMPCSLTDIGLSGNSQEKEQYYERLKDSSAIDKQNEDEMLRLRAALDYLWDLR